MSSLKVHCAISKNKAKFINKIHHKTAIENVCTTKTQGLNKCST